MQKTESRATDLRDQRLEILGRLSVGIVHDINNVLATIIAGVECLRGSRLDAKILDAMDKAARRGSEMVQQILAFARGSEGAEFKAVPTESIILDLEAMLKATFPRDIRLEVSVSTATAPALCDETQIHQVLLNLCLNARDAMPTGGVLAVSATDDGGYVQFAVHDDGQGIPKDVLPRIFEPFFTTKPDGAGTGIGLSTVKTIVEEHGGRVEVESGENGTVFRVYIPVAKDVPTPTDVQEFDGQGRVVLLVDDEEVIRNLTGMILREANYKVISARNGPAALASFQCNDIDIVVTDLAMPLMSGEQLAASIRAMGSNTPIVYITGFDVKLAMNPEPNAAVQKPFTRQELIAVVDRVLKHSTQSVPIKVKS